MSAMNSQSAHQNYHQQGSATKLQMTNHQRLDLVGAGTVEMVGNRSPENINPGTIQTPYQQMGDDGGYQPRHAEQQALPVHTDLLDKEAKSMTIDIDFIAKDSEKGSGQSCDQTDISPTSTDLTEDAISDRCGFLIMCIVMFIGDMSRGVLFPTLWSLVTRLGGDERSQGLIVAMFGVGKMASSPIFGSASVSHGYEKTLIASVVVLLCGTLIYAQAGRVAHLVVAMTVMGFGAGTTGVTRAFVADITPTRNRTTYMALVAAMQYAGFSVTPLVGAAYARLFAGEDEDGNPNGFKIGPITINKYTSPAYTVSFLCIVTIVLLATVFEDRKRPKSSGEKKFSRLRKQAEEIAKSPTPFCGLTKNDCALLACMIINITAKGTMGSFETLGIAIAKTQFDVISSTTGFVIGACGVIGCIALILMQYWTLFLTDVQLILVGLACMAFGILDILASMYSSNESNASYIFAMFLVYSIGYPIGQTALLGLFSKIVGRRPQGTLLGWFSSAGAFARMLFPVISGFVVVIHGYKAFFFLLLSILLLSCMLLLTFKRTFEALSTGR